jgi:hypothetical protein
MKISKKQAMFNSLLVNVIMAEDDYQDCKINLQTLEYVYKKLYYVVIIHCEPKFLTEWNDNSAVKKIQDRLRSA